MAKQKKVDLTLLPQLFDSGETVVGNSSKKKGIGSHKVKEPNKFEYDLTKIGINAAYERGESILKNNKI